MYDFYQLQTPGVAGCMEPKAPNYIPAATREKSPSDCQPADTCFQRDPNTGECHNCAPSTCETGNDGYRNAKNDTVKASKVEKGTITVDGDLRDWTDHDKDRCYQVRPRLCRTADRLGQQEYTNTSGRRRRDGVDLCRDLRTIRGHLCSARRSGIARLPPLTSRRGRRCSAGCRVRARGRADRRVRGVQWRQVVWAQRLFQQVDDAVGRRLRVPRHRRDGRQAAGTRR
eukprot:4999845-Prymnesium_polylepis.2